MSICILQFDLFHVKLPIQYIIYLSEYNCTNEFIFIFIKECSTFGFTDAGGVCFLVLTNEIPFQQARQECQKLGADLITFDSRSQIVTFFTTSGMYM